MLFVFEFNCKIIVFVRPHPGSINHSSRARNMAAGMASSACPSGVVDIVCGTLQAKLLDQVERTAGKALDFRGALNRISVVSATF